MRLSIITCTYNCYHSIRETLSSLKVDQHFEIEHVIIDGMSDDGTLKLLNDYRDSSNYNVFIKSEEDKGIYDAMNKGLLRASGEFILFLLAGDKLSIQIDTLFEMLKRNNKKDILAFSGYFKTSEGDKEFWNRADYKLSLYNPAIRFPCLIIKKSIYKELGFFDLQFKISSDFDLISKYLRNKNNIKNFNEPLLLMEPFGFSSNPKNFYLKKQEHKKIISYTPLSIKKIFFLIRNYKHMALFTLKRVLKK